jgi:hypothetical protein
LIALLSGDPGFYAAQNGSAACAPCPRGHFAFQAQATSCERCAVGRYAHREGSSACEQCEETKYPHRENRKPLNASEKFDCRSCPANAQCNGRSVVAQTGFFVAEQPDGAIIVFRCLPDYCESCANDTTAALAANGTTTGTCCGKNRVHGSAMCGTCVAPFRGECASRQSHAAAR